MAGRKIEQVMYLKVLISTCVSHTQQPLEEVAVNFTSEIQTGFVDSNIFRHRETLENVCAQIWAIKEQHFSDMAVFTSIKH